MILLLALLQDLPTPPPGWRIEVVARAPELRHPSVVACAPDGRVFVGEDPMDIRVPAHEKQGRILCIRPDGRITVFAEGLYAPFGLHYLEGKLYVNHAPRFSVFRDDQGVGRDRVDLIESTNPKPWALDWNDHVPANFRLAMDGYFYMSVGDKGIYGAVGRDGKTAELYGGGVLRLRPDATGLEVFSTGTRNHLDVQLNAEDELFTYDNTDEKDWWSRVTHMVEGGTYAYPWEHKPRRPWTLWMMGEYGAGAATAGFCYLEDALPEDWRGNLVLADFGKRNLLRVRIARDGASWRIVSKEDFFSRTPESFRPVGLAPSADGMAFYIGDWHHADSKADVVVGRLIKVTRLGPSLAAPKPAWYLPAATGRRCDASTAELTVGLLHPSREVRLTAQRTIAARGKEAVEPLEALLRNARVPSHARWHAIWALDAIDGGAAAILAALQDADASVRIQAARQLGLRRAAFEPMLALLRDPEAALRFHAATALGRLGRKEAVPALLEALDEKDLFARYAAFTALNRIGRADPAAWAEVVRGLAHDKPAVREGTFFALRETPDAALVEALAAAKRTPESLALLAGVHRKVPAWKGEWWAYHPVDLPRPVKSVEWEGTAKVLALLREGIADADPRVREAAVRGVTEARDAAALPALRALYPGEKDLDVKRALLAAFGALKDAKAEELIGSSLGDGDPVLKNALAAAGEIGLRDLLQAYLKSRPARPDARIAAIEALGRLRAAAELVAGELEHRDPEVRRAAAGALGRIKGAEAARGLVRAVEDADVEVRKAAIDALGELKVREAVPALLGAFHQEPTRFEAARALAALPDLRALDAHLFGLGAAHQGLRDASRKAVAAIAKEALPEIERRLEAKELPLPVVGRLQEIVPKERSPKLHAVAVKKADPEEYLAFALKASGDAARGRAIFADAKGAACAKCHRVGGEGGEVGPDLSGIGLQYAKRELAESVLWPSRKVREGYQQVVVRTKDGAVVAGAVRAESPEELTLLDAEGRRRAVPKAEIEQRKTSDLSLMPEGLNAGLSLQDFADLVAYLESLRKPSGN